MVTLFPGSLGREALGGLLVSAKLYFPCHLIEYLVHEEMSCQSGEVRKFLLHTSTLERFNLFLPITDT